MADDGDGFRARALPLAPFEPDAPELFLDGKIARPDPCGDRQMHGVLARRNRELFRTTPRDRAHIGVNQSVLLEHQALGGLDFLDAVGNGEIQRLAGPDQPLGMQPRLEDFAAIGAFALEHAARIVQTVGQDVDLGILPGFEFAVEPDPALALVHRYCHRRLHLPTGPRGPRGPFSPSFILVPKRQPWQTGMALG